LDASTNALLKTMAERQDALERQLSSLTAAVQSLEKRLTERSEPLVFSAHEGTGEVQAENGLCEAQGKKHSMKTEVRAVIAAAAAVAGEMAKVRKVRALPAAQDAGSAWSQQGRVRVVSSHNVR
jgi:hypothetical protein